MNTLNPAECYRTKESEFFNIRIESTIRLASFGEYKKGEIFEKRVPYYFKINEIACNVTFPTLFYVKMFRIENRLLFEPEDRIDCVLLNRKIASPIHVHPGMRIAGEIEYSGLIPGGYPVGWDYPLQILLSGDMLG